MTPMEREQQTSTNEHVMIFGSEQLNSSRPRKLTFDLSPEPVLPSAKHANSSIRPTTTTTVMSRSSVSMSPPYRRIKALRLRDTPETPKTIIQKIQALESKESMSLASPMATSSPWVPTNNSQSLNNQNHRHLMGKSLYLGEDNTDDDDYFGQSSRVGSSTSLTTAAIRCVPVMTHCLNQSTTTANVNPFTPNGMMMNSKKRSRLEANKSANHMEQLIDDDIAELCAGYEHAPKRLALQVC